MKKILSIVLFGFALSWGSANAQVVVRIGPPPVRREFIPVRPSPRHIWVGGYYRWDGVRYAWAPGYWAVPPRLGYVAWVPGRWVRQPGGWFWMEGHWR